MSLTILDREAERLASTLAKLTGETKTEAVRRAVAERLARVRRERAGRSLADELDEIALHCAGLPVLGARSLEEILGYEDRDLPD